MARLWIVLQPGSRRTLAVRSAGRLFRHIVATSKPFNPIQLPLGAIIRRFPGWTCIGFAAWGRM